MKKQILIINKDLQSEEYELILGKTILHRSDNPVLLLDELIEFIHLVAENEVNHRRRKEIDSISKRNFSLFASELEKALNITKHDEEQTQ